MDGAMEGRKHGGSFEEFRKEAKWQRLHSRYYGSKSGPQQVHLGPHHHPTTHCPCSQ